jgi:hypothetical protein
MSQRLFADDYGISLRSANAYRLLQESLNTFVQWTFRHGLRFSIQKTHIVIFQKRKLTSSVLFPPLLLYNNQIPVQETTKYLGVLLDSKLTYANHIKELKAKCYRAMNTLRYISHPRTGCNRKILLQIYKSLIRSKLDYGSQIYNLTKKSTLQLLDPIHHQSLRLVLGAFRTSPGLSLCAEAAESPLHHRRLRLTASFLASSAQNTDPPIFNSLFAISLTDQHRSKSYSQIRSNFETALNRKFKFSPLLPIMNSIPPWLMEQPEIRLDLSNITSTGDSITYLRKIQEILLQYSEYTHCYTDGSRRKNRTGYAYSIGQFTHSFRMRRSSRRNSLPYIHASNLFHISLQIRNFFNLQKKNEREVYLEA